MKTIKTIAFGFIILLQFGSMKAAARKINGDGQSVNHAVNTYVNAMVHGQVNDLPAIISKHAHFTMLRCATLLSFNKYEIIRSIRDNKNVEQQCTVTTSVIKNAPDTAVVRVDMKYSLFTRTNYVTVAHAADGWKIAKVYSEFD